MPQYLLSVWCDEPYADVDLAAPEAQRPMAQTGGFTAELERAGAWVRRSHLRLDRRQGGLGRVGVHGALLRASLALPPAAEARKVPPRLPRTRAHATVRNAGSPTRLKRSSNRR
jgi:hypothetical protein